MIVDRWRVGENQKKMFSVLGERQFLLFCTWCDWDPFYKKERPVKMCGKYGVLPI